MREIPVPGSTDDEKIVIQKLGQHCVKCLSQDSSSLTFEHIPPRAFMNWPVHTEVPQSIVPDLARQLEHEVLENPSLIGFAIPATGYVEVTVNTGQQPWGTSAVSVFRREAAELFNFGSQVQDDNPVLAFFHTTKYLSTSSPWRRAKISSRESGVNCGRLLSIERMIGASSVSFMRSSAMLGRLSWSISGRWCVNGLESIS